MVWRPSVCRSDCPFSILTMTQQGAAYDAASVHFGPTIGMTDILVCLCDHCIVLLASQFVVTVMIYFDDCYGF